MTEYQQVRARVRRSTASHPLLSFITTSNQALGYAFPRLWLLDWLGDRYMLLSCTPFFVKCKGQTAHRNIKGHVNHGITAETWSSEADDTN